MKGELQMKRLILFFALVALLSVAIVPALGQDDAMMIPVGDQPERFSWDSLEEFGAMHDLSGQELSMFGPWIGADGDLIANLISYFEYATGVTVNYAGSDSFEQQIVIDIEGGSPPEVAAFPQPGLAADIASQGNLVPLGEDSAAWMTENYAAGPSWVDLGTYADENGEDQFFGFAYKIDLKSIVWYVPDEFELAGYEVPETMEDLIALSEQIIADGGTPWCIGIGSGDATGWPATDWVEDIMLRTQPLDVYDAWTSHTMPFNDPAVVNAIETFGMFVQDGWVNGGAASVATTDFRDAPAGLFTVPPQCYMHRQASFISSFFPEGTELGVDADYFYFPSFASEDLGNPVLGAGTLWTITSDSEAARAWIEFLKTPIAHEVWMAQSGLLTPLKTVNLEAYANDTLRKQGEILLNATSFRFDGSDLMPGAIGAGAFWTGMVDFVNGASAQEVADAIEAAWAALD